MAEIREQYPLLKAKLSAGEYDIAVTSTSEGLKESEYSKSVPYTQDENLHYEYSGNNYYIVTGTKIASTDLTISHEYDDGKNGLWEVREIGVSAFSGKDIVSVKIPSCIKLIGEGAFSKCESLETVEIIGLEEIAVYFRNNRNWSDTTCSYEVAGESVEKIMTVSGNGICRIAVPADTTKLYFSGINTLGKKEKTSITSIFAHGYCFQCTDQTDDNGAFYVEDYEYESAETSDYVTIGTRAFEYCSALTSINIPNTVRIIDTEAFYWCSKLKTLTFAKHCPLISLGDRAFQVCNLVELNLPDMLTSIGDQCFSNGYAITKANIPNRLKTIGSKAFQHCTSLVSFTLDANKSQLESLGGSVFYNCASLRNFTFPATVGAVGGATFLNCDKLETVTFKNRYGWFYTDLSYNKHHLHEDIFKDDYMLANILSNNVSASAETDGTLPYNFANLNLTKLFQMPAPEISLSLDGVLTITDSTGIADMFTIYAKTSGSDDSNYQAAAWIKDLRKGK